MMLQRVKFQRFYICIQERRHQNITAVEFFFSFSLFPPNLFVAMAAQMRKPPSADLRKVLLL